MEATIWEAFLHEMSKLAEAGINPSPAENAGLAQTPDKDVEKEVNKEGPKPWKNIMEKVGACPAGKEKKAKGGLMTYIKKKAAAEKEDEEDEEEKKRKAKEKEEKEKEEKEEKGEETKKEAAAFKRVKAKIAPKKEGTVGGLLAMLKKK